jgi:DNA polymerase III epsilon subunit-like protein
LDKLKDPKQRLWYAQKTIVKRLESQNSRGTTYRGGGAAMSRKQYPHLPNHKLETLSRYLLGESCEQMQMHRALDDAKLAAMIWLEMGKA